MTRRESRQQAQRIVGLFPDLLGVGGVQEAGQQTVATLNEIAPRHGWVTYFLSLNDPPGGQAFHAGESWISFRGFGRSKCQFVLSAFRQSREEAHIVFAAHPHLALRGALMKLISPRLKTFVMAHGAEVCKPLPWLQRTAPLYAGLALAPSRDTVQKLIDVQGVSPERIRILAWPLSPNFLRMANAPPGLPLPIGFPQGRVILTVGRWAASERYKGADELIRAMPQLCTAVRGLHLVAVGAGDDLPRLRKLAAACGVTGCIHFLENLSQEELAACCARADVFALPSTGEGFRLVFLEAMAFAKPVVGAAFGGITDLVENGVNGLLVPPRDTDQLGAAFGRLLGDKSLCKEMGQRGAEIVRQRYEFGLFQSAFEKMLKDCGLDPMYSA
jgi:glycosyltransferase involved in cell wall biosynthesis